MQAKKKEKETKNCERSEKDDKKTDCVQVCAVYAYTANKRSVYNTHKYTH